jgi:phosphomannomutase
VVLRFEGHTAAARDRIQSAFMSALRAVKPDAQFASAAH